jgi:hypothetical protein
MTDPPSSGPFRLALPTVLGVVLELLVMEEELLACAEHELNAAINTRQVPISKSHRPSRQNWEKNRGVSEGGVKSDPILWKRQSPSPVSGRFSAGDRCC